MKFAEHLSTHLTPEWRKQYIDYDKMKDMLYDILGRLPSPDAEEQRSVYLKAREMEFFAHADAELNKINLFFSKKLAEAKMRFIELQNNLDRGLTAVKVEEEARSGGVVGLMSGRRIDKLLAEIKFAFNEFYLSLILIQNYQELNFTGFRKIMKKHDKLLECATGIEWRQTNVFTAEFYTNKEVDKLITDTEDVVIHRIEKGDRSKAMKRLRVQPMSEVQSPWTTFRLGYSLGCFFIMVLIIAFAAAYRDPDVPWIGVRLFRGTLFLGIFLFLLGANVYGWQASGVNHVLIFAIDPRKHLTYQGLMEIAATYLVFWASFVLMYLFSDFLHIPKLLFPFLFLVLSFLWLINPIDIWHKSSRYWFLRKLAICFAPLCFPVTFPDFWLADQMNSMITSILDIEYFICFYASEVDWADGLRIRNLTAGEWPGVNLETGRDTCMTSLYGIRPIVTLIPAMIRFLQCIRRYMDTKHCHPHITNAGKYSTTFFVVITGTLKSWYEVHYGASTSSNPMFYVWLICYIVSTCYTYTWDIKMDWGLLAHVKAFRSNKDVVAPAPVKGKKKKQLRPSQQGGQVFEHPLLREELVYNRSWYYYVAAIANFCLRMAWTLNISLSEMWDDWSDLIVTCTAFVEVFRRFVWNFFRLENEHLNNCGNFRAIRDITLKIIPHEVDKDELAALKKKKKTDDDASGVKNGGHRRDQSPSSRVRRLLGSSSVLQAVAAFKDVAHVGKSSRSNSSNAIAKPEARASLASTDSGLLSFTTVEEPGNDYASQALSEASESGVNIAVGTREHGNGTDNPTATCNENNDHNHNKSDIPAIAVFPPPDNEVAQRKVGPDSESSGSTIATDSTLPLDTIVVEDENEKSKKE